ncbi:MAG: hypothetical protein PHF63_07525 [Herbinix sp.]|nr:hypothetical protein [Herbinix sp.]
MKKRIITVLLISCLALYVAGCGTKIEEPTAGTAIEVETDEHSEKSGEMSSEMEPTITPALASDNGDGVDNQIIISASAAAEIDMVNLPEGIIGIKSESKPNKALQQLIIDYYEIPKDFYDTTRYYYNYVDLNNDGTDEIFVVVIGPYTSGTGGSSALWVIESAGELHVNQDFTIVNTPVIVSDTVTNGAKELIIPYYGGGAESQYSVLTCSDGFYPRVADGKMIDSLNEVTGTAIIANDMLKEVEAGIWGLNLKSE